VARGEFSTPLFTSGSFSGETKYSSFYISSAEELTDLVDRDNTPRIAADPLLNFLGVIGFKKAP
jgi:hypothetical protein